MYDYRANMMDDVREAVDEWLKDHGEVLTEYNREYISDRLNDDLWDDDSVTGNGSGSYTMSRNLAKEFVVDNMELLAESLREFGESTETILHRIYSEDWEFFDVTIRCYLLGQIISEVLSEKLREK